MLNGYAPELRGDIARFERFRTRWLGNDPSSYATIWRMLAAADMQDELARLACPVLVIGGSLDRVRPPALAESVAKTIPGARYVEIRTGHYMAVQTPDLLSDCIDEFLTIGRRLTEPDRPPQASRSFHMNRTTRSSRFPASIIARSATSSSPPSATAISTAPSR